jgi:hypothetical protein
MRQAAQRLQALPVDLCDLRCQKVDRCVLYVFRCAVYAATNEAPDPELLKWWSWKA